MNIEQLYTQEDYEEVKKMSYDLDDWFDYYIYFKLDKKKHCDYNDY